MRWLAKRLNPLLRLAGLEIIAVRIGHWTVREGQFHRTVSEPLWWRLGKRTGLPAEATSLERLLGRTIDPTKIKLPPRR